MSNKYFIWRIDDQLDGRLRRGERHDAAAFDPDIVEEWIRTGAAEWAKPERSAKPKED